MGLGKTVQTIGFLSHLRSKNVMGPFLVVGPLSTLPNWVSEFERWCPTMPAVLYHGSRQERAEIRSRRMPTGRVDDKFPVIITSYEIVMADSKFLQKYQCAAEPYILNPKPYFLNPKYRSTSAPRNPTS